MLQFHNRYNFPTYKGWSHTCNHLVQFCIVANLAEFLAADMGNRSSMRLREEDIEDIQAVTGFSPEQIECLYRRFTTLCQSDEESPMLLRRSKFLQIPELALNPLASRIVHTFFENSENECINFGQFVGVLARFRPIEAGQNNKLNSLEEKLLIAFKVYDVDGDGYISLEDVQAILHMMIGECICEDQLKKIAQHNFQVEDYDKDHKINFEEFCHALSDCDVEKKLSLKYLKHPHP